MSAELEFTEQQLPQLTSSRGGTKRKRGQASGQGGIRASPMSRRNQSAAPATEDASLMPTASVDDTSAQEYLDGNGPDYLPHLAPNPSASPNHGVEDSSMDTAVRALNFTMSATPHVMEVPQHPADVFLEENGASNAETTIYNPPEGTAPTFEQITAGDDVDEDGAAASSKPQQGSVEWEKVRKDNHKEVERRRRETINEGINELAKHVPGCEKNKGQILMRAVAYIEKLHDEASTSIDKWTFEKLVTEQAINDLSGKLHGAWKEKEAWKRLAKEAGVDVDNVDLRLGVNGDSEHGDNDVDTQDEAIDVHADEVLEREGQQSEAT